MKPRVHSTCIHTKLCLPHEQHQSFPCCFSSWTHPAHCPCDYPLTSRCHSESSVKRGGSRRTGSWRLRAPSPGGHRHHRCHWGSPIEHCTRKGVGMRGKQEEINTSSKGNVTCITNCYKNTWIIQWRKKMLWDWGGWHTMKPTHIRGVWGHAPPGKFECSKINFSAFWAKTYHL